MRFVPILACVALVSCQPSPTPAPAAPVTAAAPVPVPGDTLVVALGGDLDAFNPIVARGSATGDVLEHLFPCLVTAGFDGRLRLEPGLAESWSFDATGTELTLHLRSDVTWQDGEPVDADDVLYTLETSANPAAGSPRLPFLRSLGGPPPFEKLDSHTVVVRFAESGNPDTQLANVARALVAPEHALRGIEPAQLRKAKFGRAPVASGPYLLTRWDTGEEVVLTRREGSAAYLDRVVLRVLTDDTARIMAFRNREVDLLPGVSLDAIEGIQEARPDARIVRRGYRFLDYVGWNLHDERFEDPRIRQALAHAVDVDALIEALLTVNDEPYGRRAVGTVSPELSGATDPGIVPLAHDPALARALLAEAGRAEGLSFTLVYTTGNQRREQAALVIQQQLAEVGVRVELSAMDRNTLIERLRKREFEAVLAGWSVGLVVDPSPYWHSGVPSEFNYTGYANPEVDVLIDQGLAATDPEIADDAWRQMQRLIHDDQPYLFLWWIDDLVAIDPRFRDATPNILGTLHGLEHWWVPADEQRYR